MACSLWKMSLPDSPSGVRLRPRWSLSPSPGRDSRCSSARAEASEVPCDDPGAATACA